MIRLRRKPAPAPRPAERRFVAIILDALSPWPFYDELVAETGIDPLGGRVHVDTEEAQ